MKRCVESLEVINILLRQILLQQAVIQVDETSLKVVKEDQLESLPNETKPV